MTAREQAEKAQQRAEKAQHRAEDLLHFLLGEQFLGEVRDVGRSSMLEQVKRKVQTYADDRHPRSALIRGLALRNAGDIERMHGNTKESLALFGQALEAIESSPQSPSHDRETARTHERLGEALAAQGQVTQALKRYEAAVQAWRRVIGNTAVEVADCISFADSLVGAGELKNRIGRAADASKDLAEALGRVTTVPFGRCGRSTNKGELYPTAEALVVLSRARMLRATIYNLAEDYEGAVRLAGEAKRLSPASPSAKRQEATALASLANSKFFEKPQDALQDYRPILAEFDLLLHHDPTNRLWKREQAAVQLLIAEAIVACHQTKAKDCQAKSSLEEAELTNLKAFATLRALAKDDPSNMALQRDLGWALQGRAQVLASRHEHVERLTTLQESERLYADSIPDPSDAEGALPLGRVLLGQSKALADRTKWSEAKATLQKSITTYETYGKESGTQEDNLSLLAYLIEARTEEGELLRKAEDKKGADQADLERKRLQDLSDNLYYKLFENNKEESEKLNASRTASVNQGAELFKKGDHAAALLEFKTAESVMREYINLQPSDYQGYDDLRDVYDRIRLTQKELGQAKEAPETIWIMVDMAQIASLLSPKQYAPQMNDKLRQAQQSQGITLYKSSDFKDHMDETLAIVQREIANAEAMLQTDPSNTNSLKNLGNAYYGQGLVSRDAQKDGWEEAIRIGMVYIQKAAAIDKKNPQHAKDLGDMHKYLADKIDADGLKEMASVEYRLALKAYQQAARLSPDDKETQDAIRELEGRGIR
ncbi:MAG: hypothetical protein CV089_24620 [Nitrospira sp. WS110]|nr:hypothetical protein [Nitrospira sp. WS110]